MCAQGEAGPRLPSLPPPSPRHDGAACLPAPTRARACEQGNASQNFGFVWAVNADTAASILMQTHVRAPCQKERPGGRARDTHFPFVAASSFPSTVTVAAAPADHLRGRDRGAGAGEGPRSAEGVGGGRRAPGLRPLGRAPRQALCRRPRAGDHRQSRRLSSVCPDLSSAAPLSPRPASPWPRTRTTPSSPSPPTT